MNKKMMSEDDDIENMGIMQGLMDLMDDEGDDEGGEDPEMMMERRPGSPEILMNNLRGDMRSIDARRDELADLVGYQAATETPEQVLAMLQPILAQQGGGGIGALPQSQPMAQGPQPPMMGGAPGMPPPGMPPMPPDAGMAPPPDQGGIAALMASMGGGAPGMPPPGPPGAPPAMPPGDMPPMAMARGGYVQNFQAGSDEDGVVPAGEAVPAEADLVQYPPDLVAAAKRSGMELFNKQPTVAPTLSAAMLARLPEYNKLLGPDKAASEAQLLFDLGQRAFGFAANTDDAGRPLSGSFMSRLAGATRTLPAAMGKRIDEIGKIDRQLKALALQQGEKDIDQVNAQNSDLQKRKNDLMNQINTAQGRISAADIRARGVVDAAKARAAAAAAEKAAEAAKKGPLGSGNKGDILNTLIQFAPLYAAGSLEPEQRNAFMTAVTDYTQPTVIESTDPETGLKSIRTQRNELPDFVREALGGKAPKPSTTTTVGGVAPPVLKANPVGLTAAGTKPEIFQIATTAPKSTFFDLAATGTGFVPVLVAGVARNVPLSAAGNIGPEFQQSTTMIESMTNRVVNTLQENPRFAEGERQQILGELKLTPRLFSNKNAYINQIISLDNVLEGIEKKVRSVQAEARTGISARNDATKKLEELAAVRDLLGIQQRTVTDPAVWKTLPPGEYIVLNPKTGFKQLQIKYDGPAR